MKSIVFTCWISALASLGLPAMVFAQQKGEIKFAVPAEKIAEARRILKLDEVSAGDITSVVICFFDTSDADLNGKEIILRARQKGTKPGETTVKLRNVEAGEPMKEQAGVEREIEWSGPDRSSVCRSLDGADIEPGLVEKTAAGEGEGIAKLFTEEQKELAERRNADAIAWEDLKRFGPVKATVWKDVKLSGFGKKITVESWPLEKDGKTLEILELSVKEEGTQIELEMLAKSFYEAIKELEFEDENHVSQSKTKTVLEFYAPGH